jgi:hypothetical protein
MGVRNGSYSIGFHCCGCTVAISTSLQSVTTQKTNVGIFTAMRTSNLMYLPSFTIAYVTVPVSITSRFSA